MKTARITLFIALSLVSFSYESAYAESSNQLERAVKANVLPITVTTNHEIIISASNDVVTLSGAVSSASMRHKVEDAARNTVGVKGVLDMLTIDQPSDQTIASDITQAITESCEIQNLKVDVHDGVATLSGTGNTHKDTDAALTAALMVEGVKNVKSDFQLKTPYRWTGS